MSNIHLTKMVIETTSPMVISSGNRETGFDNQLVRDANGLPYIPATAVAGVWRSLAAKHVPHLVPCWFGQLNQAALLQLSSACLHDSHNRPVQGLLEISVIEADPVLSRLYTVNPLHRDRVAINDRGVAKDEAKFEQIVLPSGIRFSLTFKWHQTSDNVAQLDEWMQLLQLWSERGMAFGGSTRNGLGQIKVQAIANQIFDLTKGPAQALAMQTATKQVPKKLTMAFDSANTNLLADIPLKALDNWRCGAGSQLLGQAPDSGSVGIISYSEPALLWQDNAATWLQNKAVLCGSSIKGILAHRVAFHYRRRKGIFAEQMADCCHDEWQQRPEELSDLFGNIAEKHEDSRAGVLYVDDSPIVFQHTVLRTHNAIDRFTGGVLKGALYTEELLYQPEFRVRLWLSTAVNLSSELKQALLDTLQDLIDGVLPLGAGSGRGNSLVQLTPNTTYIINTHLLDIKQEVA